MLSRSFSCRYGFIFNIFTCDPEWQRPDNFLLSEVLYFLAANRKRPGQIGLEGYFTCRYVSDELQRIGYSKEDVLAALNVLLKKELISADHMNFVSVGYDDSVHILPSGYIHVRILATRLEYLQAILATTPIFDESVARELAEFVRLENVRGGINRYQRARAVEAFYSYLVRQRRSIPSPFIRRGDGGAYILSKIQEAIRHFYNANPSNREPDALDI